MTRRNQRRNSHPGRVTRSDRGASLIMVSMLLVPLMIVVAMVLDIGAKRQREASAQNAVDAAALAATYSIRNVKPGDLGVATRVAHQKVEASFRLEAGAWDSCTDSKALAQIAPGQAGTCVSFAQKTLPDGSTVWIARVVLPPTEFPTLFASIFGRNKIEVASAGGADGGATVAPTTVGSTTTTTVTPEEACKRALDELAWGPASDAATKAFADWITANPGLNPVAVWWNGTDAATSPPPSSGIPTYTQPDSCIGVGIGDASNWPDKYTNTYAWAWFDECRGYWWTKTGGDWSLLAGPVCEFPGVVDPIQPTVPGGSTTSTPIPIQTTTTRPITLG